MNDLISRQAAIKALKGLTTWWAELDPEDAVSAIENLPSAQPEIIRCKDCKHIRHCGPGKAMCQDGKIHELDWYCADGERREQCD